MKRKNINYIYLLVAVMTLVSGGCKKTSDFLALKDRQGIDAQIWEQEGAVQYLLNETYDKVMPCFPYEYTANNFFLHEASDESYASASQSLGQKLFNFNGVLNVNDVKYIANKYQGDNIGDNRYFDIAKCNMGIANLPNSKTIPLASKRAMLGQFYILRAMAYFNLTKYYGGVPLVLEPQNPSHLTLAGRAKARDMFQQICKDLDSGMANLDSLKWKNDATERGKLNGAAAAALKAKALLYWASPQFNPVNDPKHPYDQSRWDTAFKACKEAYEKCLTFGYDLMPNYATLFQVEGLSNREAVIVRSYSNVQLKRGNNVEARSRPASEGGNASVADCYYPSTFMVDAYTMNDGLPINKSTNYDPVLFWKNRDPRFEATIAYNGCTWKLSGVDKRRQWTYVKAPSESGDRGLYVKRFSSPDLPVASVKQANDAGGSGMDWIELRFAEVILNYAEAANEVGDLALAKELVRKIRIRAGIHAGASDYGLALATNKEEMRDLIMYERMVEFAFEGKRADDLRRTRRMHQLTGQLGAIQFEVVNDTKKKYLEQTLDAVKGTKIRDLLDINNKDSVLAYFKYPYKVQYPTTNVGFSMPEYYYFLPLHDAFINSSALLEQTIGWGGGTFDPL